MRIKICEHLSGNQQENLNSNHYYLRKKVEHLLNLYSRTRSCLKNQYRNICHVVLLDSFFSFFFRRDFSIFLEFPGKCQGNIYEYSRVSR